MTIPPSKRFSLSKQFPSTYLIFHLFTCHPELCVATDKLHRLYLLLEEQQLTVCKTTRIITDLSKQSTNHCAIAQRLSNLHHLGRGLVTSFLRNCSYLNGLRWVYNVI